MDGVTSFDQTAAMSPSASAGFESPMTGTGCGHVQVIFGPMFSGKSTELLRRVRRYTFANKRCLVIKYENDKRYSEEMMATHDKLTWQAVSASKLRDVFPVQKTLNEQFDDAEQLDSSTETLPAKPSGIWEAADVVGIDEGQFFPDLVDVCEELANAGKIVIVAALDGTFQRKPFESTINLLAISESITKLTAVCMGCFRPAAFSKRLGNETAIEVIGGADKYVAACRDCFNNPHAFDHIERPSSPTPSQIAKRNVVSSDDVRRLITSGMPGSPE